jgi:hypothetical protein
METSLTIATTKISDTTSLHTFQVIQHFVSDLYNVFKSKGSPTPLDLYYRLIQHVDTTSCEIGVEKYTDGFKVFFVNYEDCLPSIEKLMTIPRDTVIRYGNSPKVYLEIQKYLYKSNAEQREVIRQHLLIIAASIDPDEKKLTACESAAPILEKLGLGGSNESKWVQNIFKKTQKSMEGKECKDPMEAVMHLAPVIPEIIGGLIQGVENKTLDLTKLIPVMTNTVANMAMEAGESKDGKVANFLDLDKLTLSIQSAMGQKSETGKVLDLETDFEDVD